MGTTGQSITLANSIIGVGILAMPFCFQQCGVLLATIILLSMGLVSRLCCYFLLKSALIARRRNFEFLAFHVFGSVGKLGVEVGIIGFLMGTCIAYFVVVGDLGPQIVAKMFNINQSDILRTSIMVVVSLVCVLPLGLLRNVDSLSNVSAATICFYFCLVMKVIAEAGAQLLTGAWQARVQLWRPAGVLQCVPIFSMALFCQTQLFEIFESLPTLSLEKMSVVTKNAINICTAVYFTLGLFGYIAFSAQDISGNILMSLSPTMASDVIKLGFVMSVAFSFPLIIFPCRASLYSLLYKKVHSSHHDHIINHSIPERSFRCLTVGIVAGALCVSLLLPNIELVLGLVGSTIGVCVCVVFPAACFVHLTFKDTNERVLAKVILVLGLIIMVLGTYANLQAAENQIDKYDEKYITKERIDKIVEDFFQKMEKSDDTMSKPEFNKNDKNEDSNKIDENVIKESVILPPNPVPPESQSSEKGKMKEAEIKDVFNKKENMPELMKDMLDKVSETHPKNLNKINGEKTANGQADKNVDKPKEEKKPPSNEEKLNMIKQQQLIETIKQHGEEQKELIKEQKEILTEIKKTKEELQKSKKETAEADAKKIAVESIKKIANVAIQSLASVSDKPGQLRDDDKLEKLADEAVQEIAQKAVETIEAIKEIKEKPEHSAPQANIAAPPTPQQQRVLNSAPNNIPKNSNVPQVVAPNNVPVNARNYQNNANSPGLQNTNNQAPPINIQSPGNVIQPSGNIVQPALNLANLAENIANAAPNAAIVSPNAANVAPNAANVAQPVQNVANNAPKVVEPVQNGAQNGQYVPQPAQNVAQPVQNVANNAPKAQVAPNSAQSAPQPVQNVAQQLPQNVAQIVNNAQPAVVNKNNAQNNANMVQNQHSHSPDEPQSYKQGEDVRQVDQKLNNVARKVLSQNNLNDNVPNQVLTNNGVQNNGGQIEQNGAESAPIRQKREVVDCTDKSTLKPEDKAICKTLIDNPSNDIPASKLDKILIENPVIHIGANNKPIQKRFAENAGMDLGVKDILASNVDLTNVALPKDITVQQNVLHHLSRSLKMYDITSKRKR